MLTVLLSSGMYCYTLCLSLGVKEQSCDGVGFYSIGIAGGSRIFLCNNGASTQKLSVI